MKIGNPAQMEQGEKEERSVWQKGMQVLLCLLVIGASVFGSIGEKAQAQSVTVSDWPELVSAFQHNANGNVIELGGNIANQNQESVLLEIAQGKSVTLDLNGYDLTIENVPAGEAGIHVPQGASFTLRGSQGGTLIAKGSGAFNGTIALSGAGIGGRSEEDAGKITIESGTVNAVGGSYAAGIGGGVKGAGGIVTIDGGTVTAKGGYDGAGIGGGSNGAGGIVTINGGTVTATGSYYGGAGIGGGWYGAGGSVTIDGGTVTATGGTNAAGIGGGYKGTGGIVTINGGTVTPAAGQTTISVIGAGQDASAPSLTLRNNGTITIPSGQQLIIPQGTIVTNSGIINGEGQINGQGRIHNSGTIEGTLLVNTEVKEKTYELSFDLNGAGGSPPFPIALYGFTVKESEEHLPSLTRIGYAFGGWYLDSALQQKFEEETIVTADTKLYAKWTINTYRVTFDSDGGTPIPAQNVDYGQKASEPAIAPTRNGYTFVGWYADALFDRLFTFGTPIEQATTLYAKWVDQSPPQATLNTTAGNPTNRPFEVTATFDEPVAGFDESKINVTGGTVGTVRTVSERVYAFEVTPSVQQGLVTVTLQAGAAQDLAGNDSQVSNPLSLMYNVLAPTLTLIGQSRVAVALNAPFSDEGATAQDAQSNPLNGRVTVSGNVYTETVGTYDLVYQVSDAAGNSSTVTRSVYVIEPPVIVLNGEASMTIEQGTPFVDPGATASDAFHGDLSDRINAQGTVDTGKPGVYTLNYAITNPIGQNGEAKRQVTVMKKAEPPIVQPENPPIFLTLNMPSSLTSGPVSSTTGTLALAAGQAGDVSLGQEIRLQIPAGATNARMDIRMSALNASANGLTADTKLLSTVYQLTKTIPGNFLRPVNLTLSFDPTKLANGEQAAVFYQNQAGSPWVRMEGGTIEQDRNAVGSAAPGSAVITVPTDHFTKFAVLAVRDATAVSNPNDSDFTGTVPAAAFTDIAEHWAKSAIAKAAALGWVQGYADGTFRPSGAVTRAEFTTILVRMFSSTNESNIEYQSSLSAFSLIPFADHEAIRDWASAPVAQAQGLGWVKGDASRNFRPNDSITRAEMAVILSRALEQRTNGYGDFVESEGTVFTDQADIPVWARKAIKDLTQSGLLQGRNRGEFAPSETATRAEVVQILMNARSII